MGAVQISQSDVVSREEEIKLIKEMMINVGSSDGLIAQFEDELIEIDEEMQQNTLTADNNAVCNDTSISVAKAKKVSDAEDSSSDGTGDEMIESSTRGMQQQTMTINVGNVVEKNESESDNGMIAGSHQMEMVPVQSVSPQSEFGTMFLSTDKETDPNH